MAEATARFSTTLKELIELVKLYESGQFSNEAFMQGLESSGVSVNAFRTLSGALSKIAKTVGKKAQPRCRRVPPQCESFIVGACQQAAIHSQDAYQSEHVDVEIHEQVAVIPHDVLQDRNIEVETCPQAANLSHGALQIEDLKVEPSVLRSMRIWSLSISPCQVDLVAPIAFRESLSSLGGMYMILRRSDEKRAISDLKRRFISTALFRSVRDAGYHSGSVWNKGAKAALISLVASHRCEEELADTGEEDIERHLFRYFEVGQSFDDWSTRLGGDGYLLLIPTIFSETKLADRHSRPSKELIIECFQKLNIGELIETHNVLGMGIEISKNLSEKLKLTLPAWSSKRKRPLVLEEGEAIANSAGYTSRGGNPHAPFEFRLPVLRLDSSQTESHDVRLPVSSQTGPDNSSPSFSSQSDLASMAQPLPPQTGLYGITPLQAGPNNMAPPLPLPTGLNDMSPSLPTQTALYAITPLQADPNNMAPPSASQAGSSGLADSFLPQGDRNMLDFDIRSQNVWHPPHLYTTNFMDGVSPFAAGFDWDALLPTGLN